MSGGDFDKLFGDEGGLWIVRSEAGLYLFDLDRMLVRRFRGTDPGDVTTDGWAELLGITRCEVGHTGDWMTDGDVLGSDAETHRQDTTAVVDIALAVEQPDGSFLIIGMRPPPSVDQPDGVVDEPPVVDELLGGEVGRFRVRTRDSSYVFDLNDATVQRFPGPISNPSPNEARRRIRDISECKVGARGRWTMFPVEGDPDVEYMWQHTSEIKSIEREDTDDANR